MGDVARITEISARSAQSFDRRDPGRDTATLTPAM